MMRSGFRLVAKLGAMGFCLLAACGALAASGKAGAPAPQQENAQPTSGAPQTTSATFGDWTLGCTQSPAPGGAKTCEVSETLQAQGKGPIAMILFAKAAPKTPQSIIVVLPVNVLFSRAVRLSIDDKDAQPAELRWFRCVTPRCYAVAQLKDETLLRWRSQAGAGRIQFSEGEGHDVVLPFSFKGLAEALDALSKS
jgi:invasion protein IalB